MISRNNSNKSNSNDYKLTTLDMELSLVEYFSPRVNLIVPNVSWGFDIHECDLLLISKTGYATEIEIKISKSDLKADKNKRHSHDSKKIKYLYFAIPEYLIDSIDEIPKHAGIITVGERQIKKYRRLQQYSPRTGCKIIRESQLLNKYKLSKDEQYKIARLGAMRIWNLKGKINENC